MKEFLQKLVAIGHAPSERISTPVLGQKISKNIGFKGHQIINLLGCALFLG
jgi:hypothetical protein